MSDGPQLPTPGSNEPSDGWSLELPEATRLPRLKGESATDDVPASDGTGPAGGPMPPPVSRAIGRRPTPPGSGKSGADAVVKAAVRASPNQRYRHATTPQAKGNDPPTPQNAMAWAAERGLDLRSKSGVSGGSSESASSTDERPLVFLCHSSGDKERVRELYRRLTADGVQCWFDEEDLLPGQDWDYEIRKAMRASRFVLVCLSEASVTKTGYVQKELKRALDLADEQPEGSVFLIPVRLEPCEIPGRLNRWQWVDLFRYENYERLLRALGVVAPISNISSSRGRPETTEQQPPRRAPERKRKPDDRGMISARIYGVNQPETIDYVRKTLPQSFRGVTVNIRTYQDLPNQFVRPEMEAISAFARSAIALILFIGGEGDSSGKITREEELLLNSEVKAAEAYRTPTIVVLCCGRTELPLDTQLLPSVRYALAGYPTVVEAAEKISTKTVSEIVEIMDRQVHLR